MKKLRYVKILIAGLLVIGVNAPSYTSFVFAEGTETPEETEAEIEEEEELVKVEMSESSSEPEDSTDAEKEEESKNDEDTTTPKPVAELNEEGEKDVFVVIKSFNPGFSDPYTGEFFELQKLSKNPILLAGLSVVYETSSGKEYTVVDFSEEHEMVGESLLLRLSSSNEVKEAKDAADVADLTYTRNMAQGKGRISLFFEDEVIDTVCWGLEDDECFTGFNSKNPTTLVRDFSAEEMEDRFLHEENYMPSYDKEDPGLLILEIPEEVIEPKCQTVEFSEIFTYFENSNTEQFIELFNRSEEKVELDGCFIRYKSKNYALSGEIVANGFRAIYNMNELGVALTKNPTSSNTIEIIDTDGEVVDSLTYTSGQRKGVSFAMIGHRSDGSESWVQTYNLTPGAENVYQQYKTCPIGKVINLETGNCVNETTLSTTLAACPEGKYRNPLTGRCKSYATTTSTELKPCAEGYERNPETGRCRKIVTNDGAEYEIVEEDYEEKTEFTAIWTLVAVIAAGLIYTAFQYKDEIKEKIKRK